MWYYQTCTEFGWYPTATNASNCQHPFNTYHPASYYQNLCQKMFGVKYELKFCKIKSVYIDSLENIYYILKIDLMRVLPHME